MVSYNGGEAFGAYKRIGCVNHDFCGRSLVAHLNQEGKNKTHAISLSKMHANILCACLALTMATASTTELRTTVRTLQEKYGYPKLSRLEKLGINSNSTTVSDL